jgi:hypothetical protein
MIDRNEDGGGLPPGLHDAVRVLREEAPPNDIWRQRLLRAVSDASRSRLDPAEHQRRWSLRPMTAIAAGLACVLAGAGAALVARSAAAPAPTALVTAVAQPSLVRFTLEARDARSVSLVGDFNGWTPGALPLRRSADGRTWEVEVPLSPGRYAYSFVVDGHLARDPAAPQAKGDDFGSPNSVVMVSGS